MSERSPDPRVDSSAPDVDRRDAVVDLGPRDLSVLAHRLEHADALDGAVGALQRLAAGIPPGVTDVLRGRGLGHEAHPMLTDLPIGFWTGSLVLDLVGGRRARRGADLFVGLGLLSAVPTMATGLADWTGLDTGQRRVGAVHAGANLTATLLYAGSFVARLRHRRTRGVLLGLAGASVATLGGYLGGHLAFGRDEPSVASGA